MLQVCWRDLCTRPESELKEPMTSRNLVRVYEWKLVRRLAVAMDDQRRQGAWGCSPIDWLGSFILQ